MSELTSSEQYRLSEERHQQIFDISVVPQIFHEIQPASKPKAIFVGGQPGAGKSSTQKYVSRELNSEEPNTVLDVIGDDLRLFHPNYFELLEVDDRSAALYTDRDSGLWVEKVINHGAQIGCSMVIEGTLRRPEVPVKSANFLKSHGYRIEFDIVIAHQLLSRSGVIARYLRQVAERGNGRFTLREAHDAAYDAVPETLSDIAVSGCADVMRFFRRGAQQVNNFEPRKDYADVITRSYLTEREATLDERSTITLRAELEYSRNLAIEFNRRHCLPEIDAIEAELSQP